MTFVEVPKRLMRRKRISEILHELSEKGEVDVNTFVARWLSSRSYVRELFRTIAIAYKNVELTEDGEKLILRGELEREE